MSSHKFQYSSTPTPLPNGFRDALHVSKSSSYPRRSATPNGRLQPHSSRLINSVEGDLGVDEDPKYSVFKDLFVKSEARLASLFEEQGRESLQTAENDIAESPKNKGAPGQTPSRPPPSKKHARTIEEDDYDDDSGAEDEDNSVNESPLKRKGAIPALALTLSSTPMLRGLSSSSTPASIKGAPSEAGRTTEDARKKLEDDKKATEDAAKRSFHTLFHTLENDRDAMLEQKRLEESERQVELELGNGSGSQTAGGQAGNTGQPGSLSQTNLGASSLTLKNLIRRIDDKRDRIHATDTELRNLISEVRKNRSKWASEEKIGQEELYEAAEKVLSELKAITEHSTPFLTKVNKREAPDYYNIIKHPMDLGTMTKKLKNVQYKSKQEFVDDINLIWANCLKYNGNPEHFLRRHALFMRKETEKFVSLIPNIVIRDRAEVEAEERRLHANPDGEEDSDDEPIMSSRGRKAPSKKSKKGTVARKAPAGDGEGSPDSEVRPPTNHSLPNGVATQLKDEPHRANSDGNLDGSQKDLSTPPPGTSTPSGVNGILSHGLLGTHGDHMDIDGDSMVNGILPSVDGMHEEAEVDDPEYKIWKQVTKKDRATVTAERHRLFKGESLDPEAPALRRTKLGMRRWLRKQKDASSDAVAADKSLENDAKEKEDEQPSGETLAEGMDGDEEKVLPDYYDPVAALPDLPSQLKWIEDSEGKVQDHTEEFLRVLPRTAFVSPRSHLAEKIEEDLRQIQKTQKLTSKIGVVKQMQLQSQMYQGQFQKHEIVPLVEQEAEPHVMLDDGPVMAPAVSRAALQRSAAKLLVHAGFDDFQPSALDAITDMAGDYFKRVAHTFLSYTHAPPVPVVAKGETTEVSWQPRFSTEEAILHSLQENGTDVDALDSYVTEDVERTGTRLAKTHDSMKAHLAELLRPALNDAGPDGVNAFNDGSEQFVGGDFAEELGEDFFGFKELGLDIEFGDGSMSVPLHLLKSRMYNANQAQNPSALSSNLQSSLPAPAPFAPITVPYIKSQVGLVQDFFLAKLRTNSDQPLVDDEDLPQKQKLPKPRLPPTGKITSPRKRPIKEPGPGKGHPKKKMKLNDGEAKDTGTDSSKKDNDSQKATEVKKGLETPETTKISGDPEKKSAPSKPLTNGVEPSPEASSSQNTQNTPQKASDPPPAASKTKEKLVNGETGGMISPESLEAS